MPSQDAHEQITQWLVRCFGARHIAVSQLTSIKQGPGRDVWACIVKRGAETLPVVVKFFKPSDPDAVNASLSPVATARKCALAKQELRALGLPTPICFGFATENETAVLVVEKLKPMVWTAFTRIEAAQHLARLHRQDVRWLSSELQQLVQQSNPRPQRTYLWLIGSVQKLEELDSKWRTSYPEVAAAGDELLETLPTVASQSILVHGDYFSVNILATAIIATDVVTTGGGLHIIDWETFALGDPMWDLGFLIGADRDLPQSEVDAVIAAYGTIASVELSRLLWHKRCWDLAWKLHDLTRQFKKEQKDSFVTMRSKQV